MEEIKIKDEFIRLGQAMKLAGLVSSGLEAKLMIQSGQVKLNGQTEIQRGKKLVDGDVVEWNGSSFRVKAAGTVR